MSASEYFFSRTIECGCEKKHFSAFSTSFTSHACVFWGKIALQLIFFITRVQSIAILNYFVLLRIYRRSSASMTCAVIMAAGVNGSDDISEAYTATRIYFSICIFCYPLCNPATTELREQCYERDFNTFDFPVNRARIYRQRGERASNHANFISRYGKKESRVLEIKSRGITNRYRCEY